MTTLTGRSTYLGHDLDYELHGDASVGWEGVLRFFSDRVPVHRFRAADHKAHAEERSLQLTDGRTFLFVVTGAEESVAHVIGRIIHSPQAQRSSMLR